MHRWIFQRTAVAGGSTCCAMLCTIRRTKRTANAGWKYLFAAILCPIRRPSAMFLSPILHCISLSLFVFVLFCIICMSTHFIGVDGDAIALDSTIALLCICMLKCTTIYLFLYENANAFSSALIGSTEGSA